MECKHKTEIMSAYTADESTCPVAWAKHTIAAFRGELCGKSLFCREGMAELYKLTEDISEGKAKPEDLDLMRELCYAITLMADCDSAKNIATNIMGAIDDSVQTWDAHIRRKRCTALACDKLLTFYIDATKCTACGDCAKVCPVDVIAGGEGLFHVIDQDSCIKCGKCAAVCPSGAVTKAAAGAVLPKLPEKPDCVGSFKAATAGLGGLKRGLRGKTAN